MPTTTTKPAELHLEALDERGRTEAGNPSLGGDGPVLIGRARGCDIILQDASVSRRHASLVKRDGRWFVIDLGGRHGTMLNSVKLEPQHPAAMEPGDFIRVGPYSFRMSSAGGATSTLATTERSMPSDTIVERVSQREIGALAQRRLELLIEGAVSIHQAADEGALATSIVDLALAGTGFHRAAVIRPTGSADQVEVLASRDLTAGATDAFSFSSSLLNEASSGQVARLSKRGGHQLGQSIERLDITGAICAPIVLDASVVGYIYLDSRGSEQSGYADAVGFTHAVSRLAGLALSSLKRAELQKRQQRMEEDLKGARQAQDFLCPQGDGAFGRLRYAMRTYPGRFVAGDLFDIFPLDDDRVAICFGDVTGQGVAAAIHMTAVVANLRAVLARYGEPGTAAREVNRYIAERSPDHMFVSLWVGVFDAKKRELSYVDAGHGHWVVKRPDAPPEPAAKPNGLLVGIDPDYPYEPLSIQLEDHDRLIIYSDGVIEQTNPDGEPFEVHRLLEVLAESGSSHDDVSRLFESVQAYAATLLDDDTTVASIELT